MNISDQVLSIEQMSHLQVYGFDLSNASMVYPMGNAAGADVDSITPVIKGTVPENTTDMPAYTVADVMDMLPHSIKGNVFNLTKYDDNHYTAAYTRFSSYDITTDLVVRDAETMREVLYKILIWANECDYLQKK